METRVEVEQRIVKDLEREGQSRHEQELLVEQRCMSIEAKVADQVKQIQRMTEAEAIERQNVVQSLDRKQAELQAKIGEERDARNGFTQDSDTLATPFHLIAMMQETFLRS